MGTTTKISWTNYPLPDGTIAEGSTWNSWQGCHRVSAGCANCYMFREKKRYGQEPDRVVRSQPATFNIPAKLKQPAIVFVCSWSDFFIKEADAWRDEAWKIIREHPQHYFLLLTKRVERVYSVGLPWWQHPQDGMPHETPWPNVGIGVTGENQKMVDQRVPLLMRVPAAMRFVSIEPQIEPITLENALWAHDGDYRRIGGSYGGLDWVIIGGESGPKARNFTEDWARDLLVETRNSNTATFVKQMGTVWAWHHGLPGNSHGADIETWPEDLRVQEFPEAIKRHMLKYRGQ